MIVNNLIMRVRVSSQIKKWKRPQGGRVPASLQTSMLRLSEVDRSPSPGAARVNRIVQAADSSLQFMQWCPWCRTAALGRRSSIPSRTGILSRTGHNLLTACHFISAASILYLAGSSCQGWGYRQLPEEMAGVWAHDYWQSTLVALGHVGASYWLCRKVGFGTSKCVRGGLKL